MASSSYTIAIPTLPAMPSLIPSIPMPRQHLQQRVMLSQIDVNIRKSPIKIGRLSSSASLKKSRVTLPTLSNLLSEQGENVQPSTPSSSSSISPTLPVPNISREYIVKENGVFELRTKPRRKTSPQELAALETSYEKNPLPSMADRMALSRELDMPARSIQIWFQNRRQTDKKKMTALYTPKAPDTELSSHLKPSQSWHEQAPSQRVESTKYHSRPHLHRSHSGSLEQLLQARERSFGTSASSSSRRVSQRSFGEASGREQMLDLMESDPPSMSLEELQEPCSETESETESESDRSTLITKAPAHLSRHDRRENAHPYRPSIIQRRTASLDRIASSYPKPIRYFAPISTTRQTDSGPTTPVFSRSPSVASSGEPMVATPEVAPHVEKINETDDEEAIKAADALLALWGA